MMQRKQTLTEIVFERIKTYISENQCQPGDRLPTEKEIVNMLGVSRTIVREALKSLQSQEIIDIKQGSGIFVKEIEFQTLWGKVSPFIKFTPVKFKELVDTRIILELGAIELAIQHYQLNKINQMSYWNDQIFEKALKGEKSKEEDLLFHKALFNATGNDTYIQLSSILNDYFSTHRLEDSVGFEEFIRSYKEHKLVIDSIINKDSEKAKEAMKNHLNHLYLLLES
ncbi:FadR/GntR family transcriptional regulator [Neobacillus bataviensis]|nr:GntR family transcriptional regulator [Neobacillus bataviensis]